MNIFDKTCIQILCESITDRRKEKDLNYLRRVLNKYWNVDQDTLQQINNLINSDPQKSNLNTSKVRAEAIIKKRFEKHMDVVEYIIDNNTNTSYVADYLTHVNKRLNIFELAEKNGGYVSAEQIIEALKDKDINIDLKTLQHICDICPPERGKGTGKGETICKTLFNMTKSVKGDGARDGRDEKGSIVQIKGYKARLKGAQNYGNWGNVIKQLKPLIKNKNINIPPPSVFSCDKVCTWIQQNWKNLGKTREALVIKLRSAFGNLLINSKVYNITVKDYRDAFINSLLPEEGSEIGWRIAFLKLVLEYYRASDGWTYMILIDNEGGFKGLYISEDIETIMSHIKVLGWPNSGNDRASAIQIGYKESGAPTDQAKK